MTALLPPQVPVEADLDRAPGLLDGAMQLELTPQTCGIDYWLQAVAQGTLQGLVGGHRPGAARRMGIAAAQVAAA